MSGYFQNFKAISGARDSPKPKAKIRHGLSRIYQLNGKLKSDPISEEKGVNQKSHNLAEKFLNFENSNYQTEIKNPNVLKNMGSNFSKQFESHSNEKKNINLQSNVQKNQTSPSPKIKKSNSFYDSDRKTPDKELNEKPNSTVHFTFQKDKKNTHLIRNQEISFDQSENLFNQPKLSPRQPMNETSLYMMNPNPGELSKMFQNIQNPKIDCFSSPQKYKSGYGMGNKNDFIGNFLKFNIEEGRGNI